ncbi:hypothetical protein [Rhizobium sp. P007]|uniref:phage adaptor protein n=1 Tax=Rhizobium sp. P007 TaxID=285908 RepID=UPI0019F7175D|nr:hypothetical protein [Rhizobium sp. P007]CAD7041310.1 hypothetical protein RP007_00734 [Rhizobium sp. P007]
MISTCAELIASVKDYSLRTDAPVEMLIQLAESEIAPMIKHYKALKTVDIPINANLTAPLPNDLHELRYVKVDNRNTKQVGVFGGVAPSSEVAFVVLDGLMHFSGYGDLETAKVVYWSKIPALNASNPTNWLLTDYPSVYLYATLVQLYRWARDIDGEASASASLGQAMSALAIDDKRYNQSGTGYSFGGVDGW